MKLSKKQIDECIKSAWAFLDVAESVEKKGLDALLNAKISPLVVNAAFSAELYLKAIIAIESSDSEVPRGHELEELFQRLSQQAQAKIESAFSKESGMALSDVIREANEAFVDWRYIYEDKVGLHPFELMKLCRALRGYVDETR